MQVGLHGETYSNKAVNYLDCIMYYNIHEQAGVW